MLTVESFNNNYIIRSSRSKLEVKEQWFTPSYWEKNNAVTGTSTGRNTTYFFQVDEQELVLRHYYRGGLVSKFNKDSYRFNGIENTRAYNELALLEKLDELHLNSAKPIAAKIVVKGYSYQADIIIEKIANSKDAFHLLKQAPLDDETWFNIGKTIQSFHANGVYHADLNIHNIMVDAQKQVWLIDFDRGEIREPHKTWQESNLQRLLRSLNKENKKQKQFYWEPSDWELLVDGYRSQ